LRLGIGSYTFVWAVGVPGWPQPPQPLTADGLLRKAVELGVRVVQIADNLPLERLTDQELDALVSQADKAGLSLEVGTSGTDLAQLQTYLGLARRLRSPLLRVVLDTPTMHPTPDQVVKTLREVMPEFARADVCLAIENHDRFRAAILAEIMERLGGRHVGICLDTANSLGCGEGLDTLVRVLGPWVVNLHIKDFRATRLSHQKGFVIEGSPAGRGQLDVPWLLSELRKRGRDPNAVLELWPPPEATVAESIAKEEAWTIESIRYLRQFISE
jgi:sugar phosphate isomerase/epimerase